MTILEGLQELKQYILGMATNTQVEDFRVWIEQSDLKGSFLAQFLYGEAIPMPDVVEFMDSLNMNESEILESFIEAGVGDNKDLLDALNTKFGQEETTNVYMTSSMNENTMRQLLTDYYGIELVHNVVQANKSTSGKGLKDKVYAYIDNAYKTVKQAEALLMDHVARLDNKIDVNVDFLVKDGYSLDTTMALAEYLESNE